MASNRVWNLMYVLGNTSRVVGDSANPQDKTGALSGAEQIERNGWRAWVEHHETGRRVFENEREKQHNAAAAAMRLADSGGSDPGASCPSRRRSTT